MKAYITKETLYTGKIDEVEATRLTGHPESIQVTGVPIHQRVVHKPDWHESLDDAKTHLAVWSVRVIQNLEEGIRRDQERLERFRGNVTRALSIVGVTPLRD